MRSGRRKKERDCVPYDHPFIQGYESDVERSGSGLRRRESMEKMRERQENGRVTQSQVSE